ncbi:MAG: RagB/SusD family nutrient uptake outer membrane protein [Tannerellaceae bacterium]|jgi:hypothetical protein|nr:RagB/SusD family nutrient uptake outer membrane protein [Tannerellaceae bacterium]
MKLTKYITVFAACVALLCTGCNDLEQPPVNRYTDANFWTPERAEYLVNMAYSQMYDAGRMFRDEALSDNLTDTHGGDLQTIRSGTANPAIGRFSDEWSSMYRGIKTCHIFLGNVEAQDIADSRKARMIAEVRFIRAYLYFRLTNFYGDVPFFTTDITTEESNTISRTPKAEIIAFIHQEMSEIIPNLPSRDELPAAENGRITKAAAAMLDARAYLYDSQWSNVESVCNSIMSGAYGSYSLFPSYAGLFETENEYNQEVILDRGYLEKIITWGEDQQDMVPPSIGGRTPDRLPVQSLVDNYLMLSGYTINEDGSDYDPEQPYNNRDPRLTATVIYDGYKWNSQQYWDGFFNVETIAFAEGYLQQSGTFTGTFDAITGGNGVQTGYAVRKWYSPQASLDWSSGLNIIMMRYADVLLMYAEAMQEQGKMNEDVWNKTIRPIRQRAGFTAAKALDYLPTGVDMRRVIRNERRTELAVEGLRYYDIIRWKVGAEHLNVNVDGAGFTGYSFRYQFDTSRDYLWPVPQSQIDLNKNLGQNANY